MIAFSRNLPSQFDRPLPVMMAQLTPPSSAGSSKPARLKNSRSESLTEAEIRQLADAVAAWHLLSPLGICLRRSLLRYHFLRTVDIPVTIVFGARLKDSAGGGGLGGHAWLTREGITYYEDPEAYRGFVPMYVYPEKDTSQPKIQNATPKSNSG